MRSAQHDNVVSFHSVVPPPPASDGVSVPGAETLPPWRQHLDFALDTILHSYSAVLFARSRVIGLLLLVATFVVPSVGLPGLVGVCVASGLSLALQLDRESVRNGLLGYNALLVFLAIGALLDRSAAFYVLAVAAALLTVLVHVGLSGAMRYHLRLPALSLPFVLVSWILVAAVPHLKGVALVGHPPAVDLPALPGPAVLDTFLRSLGAIFFQPHWAAGLLVLVALTLWSRIAVVHAVVGFAVAWAADTWLLTFPADFFHVYAGFNIVLTAVALGGIFYVPGPGSLLLGAAGALTSALVTVGGLAFLAPHGLPVLALPLNMVVLVTIYALRMRTADSQPRSVEGMGASPEANLAWFRQRIARFRTGVPVRLALPFRGAWVVTQGNDGPHTHQGAWRHGLDFEVRGKDGRLFRGQGTRLTDYHCYRLPVTAPCAGTVVRVVDGIADNRPGELDTAQNWGNLVLLQVAPERYFMLAHLAPGSIRVREGETVVLGQEVARCGASGRAPRPHLHVQLQARPEVGAPTVALGFHDVWVDAPEGARVDRFLTPAEHTVVRNLTPSDQSAAWARLPVGARQPWTLTDGSGDARPVELVSGVDLLGARSLQLAGEPARLVFENRGVSFFAYGVDGRSPALVALYAALLKVPLDAELLKPDARLTWDDTIDLRTLRPGWGAWLRDVLGAFVPVGGHPVRFVARREHGRLVVEGRGDGLHTVAHVGDSGLERVVLTDSGRTITLEAQGGWA